MSRCLCVQGEDPFLTSEYAYLFVTGMQGGERGTEYLKASSCCKHFAVCKYTWPTRFLAIAQLTAHPRADNEDGGREGFNAVVTDPRDFADTYFPAFRSCAQRAGASGVMCSAYPACLGSIHLQFTSRAFVCATRLQCRQRNGQLRKHLVALDQAAGRLEF